MITVGEPKNGKHRVIQMRAEIRSVLDKVKALGYTNVDNFVFVRKDGTRYNYSMAENAEKKRALEEMFSKVFIFSEYVSENKKLETAKISHFQPLKM